MNGIATAAPVTAGAAVSSFRRWYGYLLVAATLFLVLAGAHVKSNEAGLSVPDWPLSYGMFWPPMVGNVFWEHGHRAVAQAVGLLTIGMAVWIARVDRRAWLRRLGWLCLAVVMVQGLLGGLTVMYLLPPAISIAHALLAQTFLCLVAWVAYAGSREWLGEGDGDGQGHGEVAARAIRTGGPGAGDRGVASPIADAEPGATVAARGAATWAAGAVFAQLLLGALVRHAEAGLAVPFFPVDADGAWWPAHPDGAVILHMAHRSFAVVVATLVLRAAWLAAKRWRVLGGHAVLLAALVMTQVFMGAVVVWSGLSPVPTSFHVVVGAALLLATWLLVLRSWRASHTPAVDP